MRTHGLRMKSRAHARSAQVIPSKTGPKRTARIVVDDVQLTVTQIQNTVTISRVVGRDRKRKLDITSARTFTLDDAAAITLVGKMKQVVALQTARCTCDYRYGYSDHAEHCQSIYVATYDGACVDDD